MVMGRRKGSAHLEGTHHDPVLDCVTSLIIRVGQRSGLTRTVHASNLYRRSSRRSRESARLQFVDWLSTGSGINLDDRWDGSL